MTQEVQSSVTWDPNNHTWINYPYFSQWPYGYKDTSEEYVNDVDIGQGHYDVTLTFKRNGVLVKTLVIPKDLLKKIK